MKPHAARPSIALRGAAILAGTMALAACQAASSQGAPASTQASITGPLQCSRPLPEGPPSRPGRLRAFSRATAVNVGRTVGRGAIAGAGTAVAGPVGGVVAGNLASRALPSEFDIRGNWQVTDGTDNCACAVSFAAPGSWSGANTPRGDVSSSGCNNPHLASVNDWRLDETMTGLDAELLVYASNGNRIAVLDREGPDYYSGRLSSGQVVTLWRE